MPELMTLIDPRGMAIRVTDRQEAADIEAAVTAMLSMKTDPLPMLQARPHRSFQASLLEAVLLLITTDGVHINRCKSILLDIAMRWQELSEDEQQLANACIRWAKGEYANAWKCLQDLLVREPRHVVALHACHMLEFFMGWSRRMGQTMDRVVPAWHARLPLYGYVKGMQAFSLAECARLDEAEQAVDECLAHHHDDIYGNHARCHIFYERGQFGEGVKWMSERVEIWSGNPGMRLHMWWHYALFQLYQLQVNLVENIFRRELRHKNHPDGYEDLDASSMLWRLKTIGVDMRDLWQDVADCWVPSIDQSVYWFNDIHCLLAMVGARREATADRVMRCIEQRYADSAFAPVLRQLCRGLIDYGAGRYDLAYTRLSSVLDRQSVTGGSNAQRDVFELTAIDAAIRSGRLDDARRLMQEGRCLRHPSPLKSLFESRLSRFAEEQLHALHTDAAPPHGSWRATKSDLHQYITDESVHIDTVLADRQT